MRTGRPKITTAQFVDDWKEQTLALFAEGASMLEIYTTVLDIDYDTFDRLRREDEEFSQTIKKGLQLSQAWWESNGREIRDKDLNATLWYMNMKNRFGWADKQEIKQEMSGQLDVGTADPEKAKAYLEFLKSQ